MTSSLTLPRSVDLSTLAGHFDVNVKIADDAPGFVNSLGPDRQEKLKREFQTRLHDKSFTEADFNDATM